MKHGDSSPEENPLNRLAEAKAAEYLDREQRERVLAIEANLRTLYKKLGLAPGQTLSDYLGLTPTRDESEVRASDLDLDPAIGQAIDDLFEDIFSVLTGDGDSPTILGAPRPRKNET